MCSYYGQNIRFWGVLWRIGVPDENKEVFKLHLSLSERSGVGQRLCSVTNSSEQKEFQVGGLEIWCKKLKSCTIFGISGRRVGVLYTTISTSTPLERTFLYSSRVPYNSGAGKSSSLSSKGHCHRGRPWPTSSYASHPNMACDRKFWVSKLVRNTMKANYKVYLHA